MAATLSAEEEQVGPRTLSVLRGPVCSSLGLTWRHFGRARCVCAPTGLLRNARESGAETSHRSLTRCCARRIAVSSPRSGRAEVLRKQADCVSPHRRETSVSGGWFAGAARDMRLQPGEHWGRAGKCCLVPHLAHSGVHTV